jgi:hypothetical protein
MQDLNDFIGEVGTERFEIGDDNSARSRTIKDVEQFAADAFENSKVKPKSLASSDIAKMKEGKHDNIVRVAKTDAAGNIMRDADNNIIKIEARDASGKVIKKRRMDIGLTTYFNEGKASKEKLSAMDIDEMDHLSDMDLSGLTAEAKQSLTAAIEGLAGTADPAHPGDPSKRIGEDRLLASKLETRQFKALDKVRAKI